MEQNEKPSPYRFVIEILIFFTYAVFGIAWAGCGAFLKDIMKELSLTLSQASFITTSVSFAKIFGPALAGFVLYRLGLRWAFMAASALICLGILAPIAPSYPLFLLARFGMGIGGAMVVVYFTPLIMQWFSAKERVVINGINYISINTGMMIALFATPFLVKAFNGSWKTVMILYSLISIILAILWLILGREKDVNPKSTDKQKAETKKDNVFEDYKEAILDKNTWILSFSFIGILSMYITIFTYFPTFYKAGFLEMPNSKMSSLVAMAPAILMCSAIPASLLGIFLTQKTGLRLPFLRWPGLFFIISILGMVFFKNPIFIIISAICSGFGLFLGSAAFYTIPQELPGVTVKKASYMMSVFWMVCYIFATLNVWLVGKIAEVSGSLINGFIFSIILSGSIFIGSFLLPETGPARKNK